MVRVDFLVILKFVVGISDGDYEFVVDCFVVDF